MENLSIYNEKSYFCALILLYYYGEILEQWRIITKQIGAEIQVIDMPLLNTNSGHEDLTGDGWEYLYQTLE